VSKRVTELSKVRLSNKNQRHRQIKLEVNWQYVKEPNLSFKQLMRILLKPREDRPVKRKVSNNFQRKTDRDSETDPETYTDTER